MEDKTTLWMIAIVAIVAIVSIVIMTRAPAHKTATSTNALKAGNLKIVDGYGNVIAEPTPVSKNAAGNLFSWGYTFCWCTCSGGAGAECNAATIATCNKNDLECVTVS